MIPVPLRAKDGSIRAYVTVSDVRYAEVAHYHWHLGPKGYAQRTENFWRDGKRRTRKISMQRHLLGLEPGDPRQGEHINRNKLDCRDENLRIAPRGSLDNGQNRGVDQDNSSGYRGVHWDRQREKWRARVHLEGRRHHLGHYETPEEADAVVKLFRAENMPFSEDARC